MRQICNLLPNLSTTLTQWRRVWDSNPRYVAVLQFSRLAPSTARPTLLESPGLCPLSPVSSRLGEIGRSTRIRTLDLLVPNQAHYQAVLYSVFGIGGGSRTPACGFGDRRATITLHRLKLFTSSTKKAPNIISARGLSKFAFFKFALRHTPSLYWAPAL